MDDVEVLFELRLVVCEVATRKGSAHLFAVEIKVGHGRASRGPRLLAVLGGLHFQPHSHRTSECKPHLIHFRFHCVTETTGFDRIKLEIDISQDVSRLSKTCKDIEHCSHAADDVVQALT